MILKNEDMIANLLIIGCAGSFMLTTFLATVVFDRVGPNSTWTDQGIEMGMQVQATDQHIEVFMDAVLLLQTSVDIKDIEKTDENGENPEPGSIVDLFPVGAPAHGKGKFEFKIKTVGKEMMPNLSNRSQSIVPMAYVKEETFNEFMKSLVKMGAFGIKIASFMAWLTALGSIASIALGVWILYMEKKKKVREGDTGEDE